jgi:hypothetical protein
MKRFLLPLIASVTLLCFSGCKALNPFAELPAEKRTTRSTEPAPKLEGKYEKFTGRIVLAAEGYRLKLSESGEIVRLTRAKRGSELANEEIHLQKYYEKTLAVGGRRQGEWIWDADILGQWLKPGETRGANLAAPPVGQQ